MFTVLEEFKPFFKGTSFHYLSFPHCTDCGRWHWYPLKICPHCQGAIIDWKKIAGIGKLYSWTILRYRFDPDFNREPPFIIALVTFKEAPGVRLVTNIDAHENELKIEMDLEPIFLKKGQFTFVHFKPATNI